MTMVTHPQEYLASIRRNTTWNFVVNTMDLTFFHLATSFIFGSTVLSLYTSHLTNSAMLIGLIPAIQSVGYFLPQLLMARHAEQLAHKKSFIQKVSVIERLPYLAIALVILLWPDAPKALSYAVLALGIAMATLSGGIAGPAWNGMLAKVIPAGRRGLFFGLSNALGGLLGIAGARLSRYLLGEYAYPTSFGICFLLCFACHVVSWTSLTLNREPPLAPTKKALPIAEYWKRLPGLLRREHNFRNYLIGRALIVFGTMGTAFYVVYARSTFQVGDALAADLTMAALASQTVGTPVLGWLADRIGFKWLIELSTLTAMAGLILVLLAPSAAWFYAVFMLVNLGTTGMSVAGMSIVMEFGSQEELPTYVALANTLLAIPILLAPILGGWIADIVGFITLFVIALVFLSVGWAMMHWVVREPRQDRLAADETMPSA